MDVVSALVQNHLKKRSKGEKTTIKKLTVVNIRPGRRISYTKMSIAAHQKMK